MWLSKLLPQEGNFFELFDQHAERIMEAAHAFERLVEHYADTEARARYTQEVDQAERAADHVTHEVNRLIHTTFITPIDREQIHALIGTMDDVADLLQDSAETMALYDVRKMTAEMQELTKVSVECCERVQTVVHLLPKIGDGAVAEQALKICDEIDNMESQADRILRSAVSHLFRNEPDVRELIKLHGIYNLLESITDRCEDVADLVEGVVLENS